MTKRKIKKVRKPRCLDIWDVEVEAWTCKSGDVPTREVHMKTLGASQFRYLTDAAEVRRLAEWLLRAAAWMEDK